MQSMAIISFVVPDRQFSANATMPPRQRWWILEGNAVFRTETGDQKRHVIMDAYLDKGEWYFSPPNYDTYWLRSRLTDAELSADYSDEIAIPSEPTSPMEILDVHAFINKESLTDLDITFKLRNRSSKTVTSFGWRATNQQYGTGCLIEPGSSVDQKMTSSRYDYYFCNGVKTDKLFVDGVSFSDGSEWEPTKNQASGQAAGSTKPKEQ